MNPRQRDLFLWQWSQRRRVGLRTVAWRGVWIGAVGGLAFALLLGSCWGSSGGARDVASALEVGKQWARLLLISIPSFAGIGYAMTTRVYRAHEFMFQRLLQSGAVVPSAPPVLSWADRGPAIAVAVAATLIAALVLAAVIFLG